MYAMTADRLFGGEAAGAIGGLVGPKAVLGGAPVPSPDAGAAPAANTGYAGVGDVMNDPTFWLVALIGVVGALAVWSK